MTYRLFAPHCYAVATAGVVDKQPHDPRFWAFGYFEMKNRWFAELVPACRYVLSQYILWRMKLRATSTRHGAKP